jgi:N6-adenosine-specific RNA methylase IME4
MGTSVNACINSLKRHRYGAIYADPPWSFRNWSAKGTGRNAISHSDCLDFEFLAALPVAEIAADDSVLFLWAVDPLLDKALELIRTWGFEYKTVGFYWVKQNSKSDFFSPVSDIGQEGIPNNACSRRAASRGD